MKLRLGKKFTIPEEAITETFGILAARGAGKSNTAAVMAEEMYTADLPFVVIDPVGSWWGLRSSKTGSGPGLEIALFGGKRGDVPLERTGGRLVADIVVDQRLSCILDLTQFDSEAAKKQFLLDFARRLYQRNELPLHLFLEEADDYIPQRPMRDETHLLRAWENIVRRGRARGLGMTMITQRSAAINKNVLTQVQTLIAMRTTGPQDRKAIEEWIKYNDQSRDILQTLPGLATGEAWVWSPQFLKTTERVKFRQRRTFDSGSTPKMAAKGKTAKLADVDVTELREQMAETIKRAEEDDPKVLKRRITELRKQVGKSPDAEELVRLRTEIDARDAEYVKLANILDKADTTIMSAVSKLRDLASDLTSIDLDVPKPAQIPERQVINKPPVPRRVARGNGTDPAAALGKGERKVLTAIAQHEFGVDREQVTILTGYKTSTRNAYIQRLQVAGLVDIGPPIVATQTGIDALPAEFEPLPTGEDLRDYWLARLPQGECAVLSPLIDAHPHGVSRDQISIETGYKTSTRNAYIQRLQTRKLVIVRGCDVTAHDQLFK